jgi:hypothetical protein
MRVDEFLRYTQVFYPRWDETYAERLREQFALDAKARVKTLSKGQHAKLGLIAAQAHRPDCCCSTSQAQVSTRSGAATSSKPESVRSPTKAAP